MCMPRLIKWLYGIPPFQCRTFLVETHLNAFLSVAFVAILTASSAAHSTEVKQNQKPPAGKSAKKTLPPVGSTEEAKDAVRAMRSIEGKIENGINIKDYNAELGAFIGSIKALDEVLEERNETVLRVRLKAVVDRYQLAKHIWVSCNANDGCTNGLIDLYGFGPLGRTVQEVIKEFPELDALPSNGGVVFNLGHATRAQMDGVLSRLWADAAQKSKAIRSELR